MRPVIPLLALLAGACDERWVDGERLWNPEDVVASGGALYAPLAFSGEVVRLVPGAAPERLDPAPAAFEALVASSDGSTVLADAVTLVCESGQERLTRRHGCDEEPVEVRTLEVLAPDALPDGTPIPERSFAVGPWYTSFEFSPDGRFVVGLQDPNGSTAGGGVVNLQAVVVLDLATGDVWEVSVGFAARTVRFLDGGADATTGMIVLSQNEVATVDLSGAVPVPSTVYPLTLDVDLTVSPIGVATTPDEAYALITVAGKPDLYVLDLVTPSINLVSLAAAPAAMAVDEVNDRTVFVYHSLARAEVVDHRFFDVTSVSLEGAATRIDLADGFAVLSAPGTSGTHVSRLDTATLSVQDYKLNWPAARLELPDDAAFAVSLSSAGTAARMEVLDLTPNDVGGFDRRPKPFGLSGQAADVAFASDGTSTTMLLLQRGVETLFQLSWPALQVGEVELDAPPVGIGALGDGRFYVTHDVGTGMVSFWTPGGDPEVVAGFAAAGVLDDDREVVLPGGE